MGETDDEYRRRDDLMVALLERIGRLERALAGQLAACVGCGGSGYSPDGKACVRCAAARTVLEGDD